jgi:hypothetical protein
VCCALEASDDLLRVSKVLLEEKVAHMIAPLDGLLEPELEKAYLEVRGLEEVIDARRGPCRHGEKPRFS